MDGWRFGYDFLEPLLSFATVDSLLLLTDESRASAKNNCPEIVCCFCSASEDCM